MSRHITLSVITLFLVEVGVCARAAVPVPEDDKRDENVVYDETLYKEMKYRSIGPTRGGRSTTVTGVANAPFTFYMGASGGGVWKTENAGQSWENISDDTFAVGSIGAIAVAPSDPNVVYVGTGSACPRGNVSVGKGIYKSTDAGRSFEHIGLTEAGQIGRIRIHPSVRCRPRLRRSDRPHLRAERGARGLSLARRGRELGQSPFRLRADGAPSTSR